MPARVLIVDDEPNIIGTVTPLLRAHGYDVFSAMNGRAALDAVERDKPDVIVLDLGLPDMPGIEVCRHIRLASARPDPGALGARRRTRQGRRAGCRRR